MEQNISLYLTNETTCSYLPEQQSRSLVIDPDTELNGAIYGQLLALGFRRSGDFVYRPHCNHCNACIPVRIPVNLFQPKRSQKRCLQNNADISVTVTQNRFTEEHYDLYRRYLNARHAGGEMVNASYEESVNFLLASWCETQLMEFRLAEELVAHENALHSLQIQITRYQVQGCRPITTSYELANSYV